MTTKPIVVGTDGSAQAERAVEWAAREAVLRGAPLRIVSAAEMPPRMSAPPAGSGLETVATHLVGDRDRAQASAPARRWLRLPSC
jgi:nucleotide-binding universal stress UspA family protein